LITDKNKLSKEITGKREEKELQIKTLKETEKAFQLIKDQLSALEPQFKALEQSRIQENDLDLIIKIITFYAEIKTLKERTQKGSEKVKEVNLNKEKIQNRIDELSAEVKTLKDQKLDSALLSEVGNWFIQQKNLKNHSRIKLKKLKNTRDRFWKLQRN
jgi:exonuclease SbcC